MTKYHIALSFAGEDRDYVEAVAVKLRSSGVDVFYDKFEEEDLWGKDLYEHLSKIYKDQALYTVMFVSDDYINKSWGSHERKSAQARAFTESREYILPALFDVTVEVPGLLKTTGYIDLSKKSPEELAELIIKKLNKSGVELDSQFSYSDEVKADIDFPLKTSGVTGKIISDLKSYTWGTQNPAIRKMLELDWSTVEPDHAFLFGRNLYQCACGSENRAKEFLSNIRRELASFPNDRAIDFLNGMLFEVYFNSEGEFRGQNIKGRCFNELLSIQSVKKFSPSVHFIRRSLEPYKSELPFLPNTTPELVTLELKIKKGDPPTVKSLTFEGRNLLSSDVSPEGRVWRLSYQSFTIDKLRRQLADDWHIPLSQLTVNVSPKLESNTELRLPKETCIRWPD